MRSKITIAAFLILAILISFPASWASANVESRIVAAAEWIRGREVSDYSVSGFVRESTAPFDSHIFVEDQALIVLALSDYHSTHNDVRYDDLLKVATNFILSARTPRGNFYEYYDLRAHQWVHEGGLCRWDAYAIAGLAAAAYKLSAKGERSSWAPAEDEVKLSVNNLIANQRADGAWIFRDYATGKHEALSRENAILLTGLTYLGLFEHDEGDSQQAMFYGRLSEKTASWLFSTQITNSTFSAFGGFPHSDSNATQISEENGAVLLGVDSYYTIIGVLDPQASPNVYDARRVMIDWTNGFAEKMRDQDGGPFYSRGETGISAYPKTMSAASWLLQALSDIWVNLGGFQYYNDSQIPYDWTVGKNELRVDLQDANGGFFTGITSSGLDRISRTDVTAAALYGFNRAGFILVPEFPGRSDIITLAAGLVAGLTLFEWGKRWRERREGGN